MEIKDKDHKLATEKIVVDINDIVPNKWNPNRMDDFTFQQMKKTIENAGLFGAIIVREYFGRYQILDGEHRWKACVELGYTKIPVENAGEVSDKDTKFWTIYFNNTRGKDDVLARAKILKSMKEGQTSLLPWSKEDIENQQKLVDWSIEDFNTQKDVKEKPKNSILQIPIPEEVLEIWNKSVETARRNGKDETEMLLMMCQMFNDIYGGKGF